MPRLHLVRYEDPPDRDDDLEREDERVIDDAEVARLLLGNHPAGLEGERLPEVALEAADEGDALAPMRGLLLGFAGTILIWGLLVAYLVLD